jgi:hypothetical protein
MKFFRRAVGAPFLDKKKRNTETLEDFKVEPIDEKLIKYKIKLATTRNKNKQQQDVKRYAEL